MNILIIGAASAIAKATARIYAEQGHDLFLLGRNEETLAEIKEDLKVRGANSTGSVCLYLTKSAEHESAVQQSIESMGELDVALICHGSLPDQQRAEVDYRLAKKEIDTIIDSFTNPILFESDENDKFKRDVNFNLIPTFKRK